ncbi:hypothetical protein PGT21_033729 [Puccinia graminis f. sp. tritici]|uniref:Uncharacterized protein n=1 Tax=Puccinia graminis f. sp. tritici TaxID=56615 RepID=A0A5B0QY42_PUCGR|nr:hypothetical protein PGT21_033729 [Puccinia graminis f. sp. tritici]
MAQLQSYSTNSFNSSPNSITIFLDWFTADEDYNQWCKGESKRELGAKISREMRFNGIHEYCAYNPG